MKIEKELELFGGQTIRKCPVEHFAPHQTFYGSPYSYIMSYGDYAGGSPERRYGLWRFDDKALKYSLFQTAGEKDYEILSEIATEWEREMRDARHVEWLKEMPRSFWQEDDKIKYAQLKNYEDIEAEAKKTAIPKKRAKIK
jgi:hypothetical protein